jgi:HAD superfamily hydrolase (TIGR01509 family)
MTEAVIFDLYGTLIRLDRDTSPYLRLARLVRPDDPRAVVERSLLIDSRGIGDFAARLGVPTPSGIENLDADLRQDLQTAHVFEDAVEVLAILRGRGLKLGLISNLAAPYKDPFFRHGLANYFHVTSFSCDAGLRKPEPEIFHRTARGLGVSPASTVMVGDSRRSDYDGARAAGMSAVLLRRGGEIQGGSSIKSLRDLNVAIRR